MDELEQLGMFSGISGGECFRELQNLDTIVDQSYVRPTGFDEIDDFLEAALDVAGLIGDHSTCQYGLLPVVHTAYFRRRDVKFTVQTGDQGFNPTAFLFKGHAAWKIYLEC